METLGEKRDWSTMDHGEKKRIITKLIFSGAATAIDVEILIDEGMDPDQKLEIGAPVLQVAAHRGMLDVVELLLKRGANVNAIFDFGGTGHVPKTALDAATSPDAKKSPDREKIIELLLSHGAKVGEDFKLKR